MPHLPMPSIDEAAYAKNTKEQYEALGRFVEAFELMVDDIRGICGDCISAAVGALNPPIKPDEKSWEDWIKEENDRRLLISVPFNHQSMTAKPLFDIMRAIIAEVVNVPSSYHYNERTTYRDLLKHIEKELSSIYWKRNDLLHGTWLVGYSHQDDPDASTFVIRKYRITADGLKRVSELPKDATELLKLRDRCDDARTWIGHVGFCLWQKHQLSEFFKLDGKDWKIFVTSSSAGTTLPRK